MTRQFLVARVREILPLVPGTLPAAPATRPRGARTAILPSRFLNLHFYLRAAGTCPAVRTYINRAFSEIAEVPRRSIDRIFHLFKKRREKNIRAT